MAEVDYLRLFTQAVSNTPSHGERNLIIKEILDGLDCNMQDTARLQVGKAIHSAMDGVGLNLWSTWLNVSGRGCWDIDEMIGIWERFNQSHINLNDLVVHKFTPIHISDFIKLPPPSWLVKYLLPAQGMAMVYGPSGAGKTFWVLDLMLAIVRRQVWRGQQVERGRVVYIAAEGAVGLQKRCMAAARHFGINANEINLTLIPENPNFFSGDDAGHLMQAIEKAGGADVVVIDTLAQTTTGANENAGEDMGKVFATLQALQKGLECLVLLVHHAGKDSSKGARGWSGMQAALDTVIEITKTQEGHIAKVVKQKDGADGSIYPFRLLPVTLGWDDDGDIISSCVVEQVEDTPKPKAPQGKLQKAIWEAIIEGAVITFEDIAPALEPKMGKAPRGDAIRRAIDNMIERGFILERARIISLPQSHKSPQIDVCGDEAKPATISTTTTTPYRGVDVWDVEGKENDA